MTLIQEKKKCVVCGKLYNWNPDVGNMICPYCKGFPFELDRKIAKNSMDKNKTKGLPS